MRSIQFITNCLALTLLAAPFSFRIATAQDNANQNEEALIEVLQSDSPARDKAITCKRLAIFGTERAVPALAPLLADKELSSWARIAIEAIPGAAADAALRDAINHVEGRLLVGVINSIATRRDDKAVNALITKLDSPDDQVASAAAVALGHIGNAAATTALDGALTAGAASVRSAVAEGCILSAERLLEAGESEKATKLYDKVRVADVPKQRILEATRGAILARKLDGIPLLAEQLISNDKELFGIGLRTARELSGTEVTKAIVAQLSQTTPSRQALLILALADRDDSASLPAILTAAGNGSTEVRLAAIDVLGRIGNVSCVTTLIGCAALSDSDLANAALSALEVLPGADVDNDLTKRLAQANGETRRVLIELIGRRRINAIPALIAAADDADARIRHAALTSLGSTVGPKDLSLLIARVVKPANRGDAEIAQRALLEASVRMPDREACAKQLSNALSQASLPAKTSILNTLGSVGGAKALSTVGAAARDSQLRDSASQLLGKWMTADAAPVLLDLAQPTANEKYRIRALRGYIRIARQFNLPIGQRIEMCRSAWKTAGRDSEKELVLDILERYPNIEGLRLALETTKDPALKAKAERVSSAIAKKIKGNDDAVQKLLIEFGKESFTPVRTK